MVGCHPRSTLSYTLFPYTTLCRSHHHERHPNLPQGLEPGQGDRRDQAAHDRPALARASGKAATAPGGPSVNATVPHRMLIVTGASRGIGAATARQIGRAPV